MMFRLWVTPLGTVISLARRRSSWLRYVAFLLFSFVVGSCFLICLVQTVLAELGDVSATIIKSQDLK